MNISLTPNEARVIGSLIEKSITTPDQYPLSLNALTNACNQKSSREPVMSLPESTVQDTIDALMKRHMVIDKSGFGSRTTKYQHRFCNSEFGNLQFTDQELGILCVLMLRGAQTPGELRTRTNRLCKFSDVQEVQKTIEQLMTRSDGPFLRQLPRQPGRREQRYMQLFGADQELPLETDEAGQEAGFAKPDQQRIDQLEQQLEELRGELQQLTARVGQLESPT